MFFTAATLIFTAQLVLMLAITVYLAVTARRSGQAHTWWLAFSYAGLSGLFAVYVLVHSIHPALRLYIVPLQSPLAALMLLPLFQFAYTFPQSFRLRRQERLIVTAIGVLNALVEIGFAVFRFAALERGDLYFRPAQADVISIAVALLFPFALLRQRRALNLWRGTRPAASLRGYFRPLDREARVITTLSVVFGVMTVIGATTFLFGAVGIPEGAPAAVVGVVTTVTIFSATSVYLNVLPEPTSLLVKLLGLILATLTGALTLLFGISQINQPWTIDIDLPAYSSLRFVPKDAETYRIERSISAVPQRQETVLSATDFGENGCSAPIPFAFRLFGQQHQQLRICRNGSIAFSDHLAADDYQFRYGSGTPLIMILLGDVDPALDGADISYRITDDRLTVTWLNVPRARAQQTRLTFGAILYPNGTFTLHYGNLPAQETYAPTDDPIAGVRAIGASSGALSGALPAPFRLSDVPLEIHSPAGFVRDYLIDYRSALHERVMPGNYVTVTMAIVVLLIFPALFHNSLVRPMQDLLRGVERLEQGEYDLTIRPYASDELGTLARAFNQLAARLRRLISTLEERVAARTADLDAANRRLRAEILERLEAEQSAIEHQRVSAALQERERLARDLHDSLGQTLGSISIQVSTALTLLDHGDLTAARRAWEQVGRSAARGHSDVRNVIRQLRTGLADGFWPALNELVSEARLVSPAAIELHLNEAWSEQWLSPIGAINLLRIVQEALNNVLRHADADHIAIYVRRTDNTLSVEVRDDGRGFNPADVATVRHGETERFGLLTMRERAEELDGLLKITSSIGNGTVVSVTIPLEDHTSDVSISRLTTAAPVTDEQSARSPYAD